ncbi:hypothetical protein HPG69_010340, partial [Diceros bicornis minor]
VTEQTVPPKLVVYSKDGGPGGKSKPFDPTSCRDQLRISATCALDHMLHRVHTFKPGSSLRKEIHTVLVSLLPSIQDNKEAVKTSAMLRNALGSRRNDPVEDAQSWVNTVLKKTDEYVKPGSVFTSRMSWLRSSFFKVSGIKAPERKQRLF